MKKILFILVVLFIVGCNSDDNIMEQGQGVPETNTPIDEEYDLVVDLKMPGTLAGNIPNISFKSLKIKGDLNGTDIKFLRGIIYNISLLDLEDANIVEGGDSYYNITHKTESNTIGRYMFANLKGNFELILPKTATNIKREAFLSCEGLKKIQIGDNVTDIGEKAFSGCSKLEEITIPKGIRNLNFELFRDCISLTSVILPNGLTDIGIQTFWGCKEFSQIEIPNSVTKIEDSAFRECTNLSKINLPKTIRTIGGGASSGCSSLKSITLHPLITTLESSVLRGTSISSINIPDNVISIEDYALMGCNNLKEIVIPKNVSYMGFIPFDGCTHLENFKVDENNPNYTTIDGVLTSKDKSILIYFPSGRDLTLYKIPEDIKIIGDAAFFGCKIQSIYLHSNIEEIKERAFSSTVGLSEVHCSSSNPPKLGTQYNYQAFPDNVDILYVPTGSIESYRRSIWSRYFNVIEEE